MLTAVAAAFLIAAPAADSPRAHRDRALALIAKGSDEQAIGELQKALQGDAADEVAHHELGKLLFKRGKMAEAIAEFDAAVKLDGTDALALYNLGYANRKARNFEAAAAAYQRYTSLAPAEADGYFGLAESLREGGRDKEAVAAYRAYIEKEQRPTEQRWVEKARSRIAELEEPPEPPSNIVRKPAAPIAAQAAAPKAPVRPEALAEDVGLAEPSAQKTAAPAERRVFVPGGGTIAIPASAAQPAEQAAAPTRDSAAATRLAEGDKACAARDFRAALFAYQDVLVKEPANVDALVKAGDVYATLGHDDEAAEQWTRALKVDPANGAARAGLAAAGERKAARAVPASSVAELPPPLTVAPVDERSARERYNAAVALINERKFAEAVAGLDKALAAQPAFAFALVARGSARIGLGRYEEAVADYTAARAADPTLASPLFGLAEAYRGLGEAAKPAESYRAFAASAAADADATRKEYALRNANLLAPR